MQQKTALRKAIVSVGKRGGSEFGLCGVMTESTAHFSPKKLAKVRLGTGRFQETTLPLNGRSVEVVAASLPF
jgi:hypothetical protein